jgi:ArsR family transcriptional regulator
MRSPGDVAQGAALLAAASDPVRWTVLEQLAGSGACVCDLQVQVPIPLNLLSYHLRVLREAGLIAGTRRGRRIDYRLADGALQRLHDAIPGAPAGLDRARSCGASVAATEAPPPGHGR